MIFVTLEEFHSRIVGLTGTPEQVKKASDESFQANFLREQIQSSQLIHVPTEGESCGTWLTNR